MHLSEAKCPSCGCTDEWALKLNSDGKMGEFVKCDDCGTIFCSKCGSGGCPKCGCGRVTVVPFFVD